MELGGFFPAKVIDQSPKKLKYFDTDYSPYLIETDEGILRCPDTRRLQDAVPTKDRNFLDFLRNCLMLDPEERFSAKQAINHPWMLDYQRRQGIEKALKRS